MNPKRVARRWRQAGWRVPGTHPQRGRRWLAAGSLVRRRAERPSPVWSSAFVFDRPAEGRPVRILALGDADHPRVPASRRRPPTAPRRRPGAVGPAVRRARAADVSGVRQRPGVHRPRGAGLAAPGRGHDPLHRTGQALGERRWGIVQRHAARRGPQARALRHPAGSPDPHRGLAAGVQPDPPPPCPRLPPPPPRKRSNPGNGPCRASRRSDYLNDWSNDRGQGNRPRCSASLKSLDVVKSICYVGWHRKEAARWPLSRRSRSP